MTDRRAADSGEIQAAEYALGVLAERELLEARTRATSDAAFANEVARWHGWFAPLHEETDAADPPAQLWDRIEAAAIGRRASNDNVELLHRKLRLWRSASGVLTAIAASLAIFVLIEPRAILVPAPPKSAPVARPAVEPMVAMLSDKDRNAIKVVASWDPQARQLVLAVPGEISADSAHSRELWVIPAGGKPRSLGTMPSGKQAHLQLANALADLLQHGATIAISIEPPGGSPTGAPTGPVIASGALSRA